MVLLTRRAPARGGYFDEEEMGLAGVWSAGHHSLYWYVPMRGPEIVLAAVAA